MNVERTCVVCGVIFMARARVVKIGGGKCCSTICRSKLGASLGNRTGENMSEDYYSVLVCIRSDRAEAYINGLPISELRAGRLMKLTTKRKDFANMEQQLSVASFYLKTAQQEIHQQSTIKPVTNTVTEKDGQQKNQCQDEGKI